MYVTVLDLLDILKIESCRKLSTNFVNKRSGFRGEGGE